MEKIEIEERINLYSEIYHKAYEQASKVHPDNARYIASEIFREVARDLRSELISKLQRENSRENKVKEAGENKAGNNQRDKPTEENDTPATEKQRHALHKFGLENVPENMTKKEASEILNSLISLSKEGDREAINEIVEELNARGR
jgi:hypothetical protein